tara:strand:- start:146 stop:310 length:165 start_codon:yes stop_codon:yes gene_type:complete
MKTKLEQLKAELAEARAEEYAARAKAYAKAEAYDAEVAKAWAEAKLKELEQDDG